MDLSVSFLCLFVTVLGYGYKVKSVSVMEGDSVTLHTELTHIQTVDLILWVFVSESTRIAQHNIAAHKMSVYDDALDGRFRHRLMLDHESGSLTITNITVTDAGLYELQIIKGGDVISRPFSVIVYAALPVPDITSECPPNSSSNSKCVVLCSVCNVSDVSLSWYKGMSLLSSISVSDLNIRLSLPLEVEYQDTDTYTCVINNTITNTTQHHNITQLCHKCSGVRKEQDQTSHLVVVVCFVTGLVFMTALVTFFIYRKCRKTDQSKQASDEELAERDGLTSCVSGADEKKPILDKVKYITVKAGDTFDMDTGVTDIQACDLIQWKFGEAAESTNPFTLISRIEKNNKEVINNKVLKKRSGRLKLNKQTGSITIKNIRTTDAGVYKLEINNSTDQICKCFFVTVSESTN